jgi:Domain of unknown function (DUF1942)
VVQQWTVSDLRASAVTAPGYPFAGRLWEATVSVQALTGTVTPVIPNVYAVSKSGDRYQVLWQLASPTALPGATINQGQTSTGKLYFDVTGADPLAVICGGPEACDDVVLRRRDDVDVNADVDGRLPVLRRSAAVPLLCRNDVIARGFHAGGGRRRW